MISRFQTLRDIVADFAQRRLTPAQPLAGLRGRVSSEEGHDGAGVGAAPIASHRMADRDDIWTRRLVIFLRLMAVVVLCKGLYHWAKICGIGANIQNGFEIQSVPYQTATIYFAVIDLVAAVGIWLAAPWGAVVWLTAVVSMAIVELMFPQVFGGGMALVAVEFVFVVAYLALAWMASRESPP